MEPSVPHLDYRPDLEGLRGVAVLSVFAVHSLPHAIGGGFVGVDVFFVLSGYLIASITLAELSAGRFSVLDFYSRRVRRLAPALLTVLVACLFFGALVAYPKESREIGKHVAGGAASVSNLVLWREGGYFDVASEMKPLLHLWSLGIEEQFYLLWPLLAPWLFRRQPQAWRWVAAVMVASFVLNVYMVVEKPKGTFFLPPTRFWEILVGVLLAFWTCGPSGGPLSVIRHSLHPSSLLYRRLPDVLAAGGVVLLLMAVWLIDKTSHFPGSWALLPTTATFLLIAAGTGAWINRTILVHPVIRFYGRISYPLYLWHWPLLTLPHLIDVPLSPGRHVLILCASVVLATLTFYFVEHPFRWGRLVRHGPRVLVAGLLLTGGAGLALMASNGLLARYANEVQPIALMQIQTDYEAYRVERCFLRSEQSAEAFSAECVPRNIQHQGLQLLWGDSHAAALYPGLRSAEQGAADAVDAASTSVAGVAQFTAAACPPLLGVSVHENRHCAAINDSVLKQVETLRPPTVVLAAYWSRYDKSYANSPLATALARTVQALHARGVAQVIVVGALPQWPVAPPNLLLGAWTRDRAMPERSPAPVTSAAMAMDRVLRDAAESAGAQFISPLQLLCNGQGCRLSVQEQGQTHAIAFDETHLTAAGSRWLWAQAIATRGQ